MIFQAIFICVGVCSLSLQISTADSYRQYRDFLPKGNRQNDQHSGRIIFYRSIGRNSYYSPDASVYPQSHQRLGTRQYVHRDPQRYNLLHNYNNPYRHFNTHSNRDRNINKNVNLGYSNYYNNPRKDNYEINREKSIADYVQRYNYKNINNPHYHNSQKYFGFNRPSQGEIVVEEDDSPSQGQEATYEEGPYPSSDYYKNPNQGNYIIYEDPNDPNNKQHEEENNRNIYYNNPDYDTSDEGSGDKEIDPELVALYEKVAKEYIKQKIQRRNGNKKFYFATNQKQQLQMENDFRYSEYKKQSYNEPQNKKLNFILNKQHNKVIFPGPINFQNKFPIQSAPFKASPQFHKYSELDPLYHPNTNSFGSLPLLHLPNVSPPTTEESPNTSNPSAFSLPTVADESPNTSITTEYSSPITAQESYKTSTTGAPPSLLGGTNSAVAEEGNKFPDSINAQLPPPKRRDNTQASYITATVINPETTENTLPPTEPMQVTETVKTLTTTHTVSSEGNESTKENQNKATQTKVPGKSKKEFKNDSLILSQETIEPTEKTNYFFLPTPKSKSTPNNLKNDESLKENVNNFNESVTQPTTQEQNYLSSYTSSTNFPEGPSSTENELYIRHDSTTLKVTSQHETERFQPHKMADETKINEKYKTHTNNSSKLEGLKNLQKKIQNSMKSTASPFINLSSIEADINLSLTKYHDNGHVNTSSINEDTTNSHLLSATYSFQNTDDSYLKQNDKSSTVDLVTEKQEKENIDTHYIMSIINQARSHQILSQNSSYTPNYD